jgi:hypothetical protein
MAVVTVLAFGNAACFPQSLSVFGMNRKPYVKHHIHFPRATYTVLASNKLSYGYLNVYYIWNTCRQVCYGVFYVVIPYKRICVYVC